MKNSLLVLLAIFFSLNLISCNSDDDGDSDDFEEIDLEDREIRSIESTNIIADFMETYGYNDLEFCSDPSLTDQDITFYKVSEGANDVFSGMSFADYLSQGTTVDGICTNGDLTPVVQEFSVDFNVLEDEFTESYFLVTIRKGEGRPVTFANDVNITYQEKVIIAESQYVSDGDLTEAEIEEAISSNDVLSADEIQDALDNPVQLADENFSEMTDNSWVNSTSFLPTSIFGQGFSEGIANAFTNFNTATPLTDNVCDIFDLNTNGVVQTNNDFGIGIAIIPSVLARFNDALLVNNNRNDNQDNREEEIDESIISVEEETETATDESVTDIEEEIETETATDESVTDIEEETLEFDPEVEDNLPFRSIVYTFSIFNATDGDNDSDGILNSLENEFDDELNEVDTRPNSIGFYDTDEDGIPNYLDSDDDNDGIDTINEIEIDDFNSEIDNDCNGNFVDDNDFKYIYFVSDETIEAVKDGTVSFNLPQERSFSVLDIIDGDNGRDITEDDIEIPFHLNPELEYNENDFEVLD